jgi:hypothetical protein
MLRDSSVGIDLKGFKNENLQSIVIWVLDDRDFFRRFFRGKYKHEKQSIQSAFKRGMASVFLLRRPSLDDHLRRDPGSSGLMLDLPLNVVDLFADHLTT